MEKCNMCGRLLSPKESAFLDGDNIVCISCNKKRSSLDNNAPDVLSEIYKASHQTQTVPKIGNIKKIIKSPKKNTEYNFSETAIRIFCLLFLCAACLHWVAVIISAIMCIFNGFDDGIGDVVKWAFYLSFASAMCFIIADASKNIRKIANK